MVFRATVPVYPILQIKKLNDIGAENIMHVTVKFIIGGLFFLLAHHFFLEFTPHLRRPLRYLRNLSVVFPNLPVTHIHGSQHELSVYIINLPRQIHEHILARVNLFVAIFHEAFMLLHIFIELLAVRIFHERVRKLHNLVHKLFFQLLDFF